MAGLHDQNRLQLLSAAGQSIWYDNIRRNLILGGELARMIEEDAVTGVTSNPTIFHKAVTKSAEYDQAITDLARAGVDPVEAVDILMAQDIQMAADVLWPVWESTQGRDGWVSIEVSPRFAHDVAETIAQARRLAYMVDRPNVLIKVPATPEGVEAMYQLFAEGACINATLIFSLERYRDVMEAYISGLEELLRRQARGEDVPPVSSVASVASFFVSRIDTEVDKRLKAVIEQAEQAGDKDRESRARRLLGKAAVASAKLAYQLFLDTFVGARWENLEAKGARVQRPLWASTSTKNPSYRDVLYVEELIGPQTINTMPENTLEAFRDHGVVSITLTQGVDEAKATLEEIEALGISMDDVARKLEEEGVKAFLDSYEALVSAVAQKMV